MARKAALEVSISDLDARVDEEKKTKVSDVDHFFLVLIPHFL